jgi:cytochrome c-type biogenesis protein CcmH/NrfG
VVAAFPASGNAWDSLGEGLAACGRKPEAILAYKRAIALDPGNRTAPAILKGLEP